MAEKNSCETCRSMRERPGHQTTNLECHKRSPSLRDDGGSAWPKVSCDEDCDEYQPQLVNLEPGTICEIPDMPMERILRHILEAVRGIREDLEWARRSHNTGPR